ncbi:MAG: hypothetical protein U5K33_07950 [Halofilum sp. (in: g-proteobacteria)]|nr:hypothetical protein [Halofilum sp. (in: g-proteobacteria)]
MLALESEAESLQQRINEAEREREAARRNSDVLAATFQQANALFSEHDHAFMSESDFRGAGMLSEGGRLARVFAGARELLGDLTDVRTEFGDLLRARG